MDGIIAQERGNCAQVPCCTLALYWLSVLWAAYGLGKCIVLVGFTSLAPTSGLVTQLRADSDMTHDAVPYPFHSAISPLRLRS